MTGVRHRLSSTPRRAWLFYFGFFGLWMGINGAVGGRPLWSAVRIGVISGVLFASLMAMVRTRSRPEALRQLPEADRETVVRNVREGTSVEDARLAPATIAYANHLRRQRDQAWTKPWVERSLLGSFALYCVYLAVTSGIDGRGAEAVWNALLATMLLAMGLVSPRQREADLRRAEHAGRSARALLERPG